MLWDGYRFALASADAPWPRVMFPLKGHERRIGEQEARSAFVAALLGDADAGQWAFAADVPTRLSYRFAQRGGGLKAQRALTDLALYRHPDDAPVLAVEFKSGGRSGKTEIDESMRKDVAAILAEQPDALWFQVVRDANDATLGGLLRTLDAAISRLSNPFKLRDYLAPGKTRRAARQDDRLSRLHPQPRRDGVHSSRPQVRARQARARLLHHRDHDHPHVARHRRRAGVERAST